MVNTFGVTSTAANEYFDDENYRLPLNWSGTDTVSSLTGNWNSQAALANGNAQQGPVATNENGLHCAAADYSSGRLPQQAVNYSGRTGAQRYMRGLQTTAPKSSIQLVLAGLAGGISPVGSGDVNVEVRLPGQTGWLDAAKPYNGIGAANDGDGCLVGSVTYSGSATLNLTFGTKTSYNSNNRLLVRLTLNNSTRVITAMTSNW
jgi:hypothetical protein